MRFHVLGVGSVGSLISHHLRRTLPPSCSVTLLYRNPYKVSLSPHRGDTITVETAGVRNESTGFLTDVLYGDLASSSRFSEEATGLIESLIVTTKAHQTLGAVKRLASRLNEKSTIVLLQNGMGIYENLVSYIFRNAQTRPHFILVSNTHGVTSRDRLDVIHRGIGEIKIGIVPDVLGRDYEKGFYDEEVPKFDRHGRLADITQPEDEQFSRYKSLRNTIAALLHLHSLNVTWQPMSRLQVAMRRKLVVNSVINPLTALMGCRNGDILISSYGRLIMRQVCYEAQLAFAKQMESNAAETLESDDPSDVLETSGYLPQSLQAPSLVRECKRVAEVTKDNISSMLADVQKGRRTEIDHLTGYLYKLGSAHDLKMPTTRTLYSLIKLRSCVPLDQNF